MEVHCRTEKSNKVYISHSRAIVKTQINFHSKILCVTCASLLRLNFMIFQLPCRMLFRVYLPVPEKWLNLSQQNEQEIVKKID